MATKIKGIFKGIKFISQIFVYREHEMEIGHPTDVKHVAHIGWDGGSMNAPSWMNEFKSVSDFSTGTLNSFGQSIDPNCVAVARWAAPDSQRPVGLPQTAGIFLDPHRMELPENPPKQSKRRKPKSPTSLTKSKRSSSNRSTSSSSSSSKCSSRSKASSTMDQGELKSNSVS